MTFGKVIRNVLNSDKNSLFVAHRGFHELLTEKDAAECSQSLTVRYRAQTSLRGVPDGDHQFHQDIQSSLQSTGFPSAAPMIVVVKASTSLK